MPEKSENAFVMLSKKDGDIRYVNLGLVRVIDEVEAAHCRLWFDEKHSIEVDGQPSVMTMILNFANSGLMA